ncbi:CDP-diacylglycerol--glycerol-3-phosphate 3-phosphatidyltransferase [Streptomyces leeuwenhoekii]|uniref:CDP-diacylglycerol--glycerol-3-phosphate 3-phosphatidyltransferase n=1 Tax=Streptomyces leeuwenhoekii TaxID=1437453 RepID=A0A0F7VV29_STRLW|nr:CDP-diacylglycerol--glycerol-3-phosphate 3-phosphatidyltransferase [Streptomyces leeuwenhoekii]KMS80762.1 phosphatidylglycerophosphate synthase [Streptomyces leeuwenhoekii]CQR61377.1 Putative CDP-diacylglycerol--glycerol-3-phosphate 3-phosphatidyl-transferase 2 [Streptomyces leeuwenhoekii]
MTGVPASAAGGSSGGRGTGSRALPGTAPAGPVAGSAIPGGIAAREAGGRAFGDGASPAGGHGVPEAGAVSGAGGGPGAGSGRASGAQGDEDLSAARVSGSDGDAADAGAPGGARTARGGKLAAAAVNQASVWNVANLLTMLRLVLVPAFVALMLADGGYDPAWRAFAWAAFAVAMITDLFDGHLARAYNLVTDFGKIADPIADKAIMGAALICLSALGDLPWWVTAVILGRELGITLLRFLVIRYGVIPASRGGKLKTLTQGVAVGMYVLALTGPLATLRFWVMAAAVVLTVVTGLDYVRQAIVLRRRGIAERRAALKETEA